MKIYKFNESRYYSADDVYEKNPAFFYGCKSNPRNIVDKKGIDEKEYLYAYLKNDEWIISNKTYCRAKLYLKKVWVDNNVNTVEETKDVKKDVKKEAKKVTNNELEIAPSIITLSDEEYFMDHEGKRMNIEIRGNRDKKEFYFSVSDVSRAFGMLKLSETISDERYDGYQLNIHYRFFTLPVASENKNISKDNRNKKLFLTYQGLVRCVTVSKSENAKKYQKWACDILFTHQFGSAKDKAKLASKLLGTDADIAQQVVKSSSSPIPCIYLFTLGHVKDLRKSMNIDAKYADNMIVCKYGKTENLERRISEHITTYKLIGNSNLALKYYSYIDPLHITEAENYIKDQINKLHAHLKYENYKELIVIDQKTFNDTLSQQYTLLCKAFGGSVTDMQSKIKDLENRLTLEIANHNVELANHKIELANHKTELANHKLEIMEKDRQIEELKNKHEIELLKKELEYMKKLKDQS